MKGTHKVLGLLEPKSCDAANLLDDFDLGSSLIACELDVKLCLLWLCSHLGCSSLQAWSRRASELRAADHTGAPVYPSNAFGSKLTPALCAGKQKPPRRSLASNPSKLRAS